MPVNASPVKSFFVSMLTRDISMEEAILDLLDNCVDGILRSRVSKGEKPYEGFKAEIKFDADSFSISDNCGGIPWSLREYAFRLGRSPDRHSDVAGSVGVYGIGMKRAIFKMGRHCLISTYNGEDQYEIEISPEWIDNEGLWEIPVHESERSTPDDGTTIVVGELYPGIAKKFGEGAESFQSELVRMIATHYAYIIDKGFVVTVNGGTVKPLTTRIVYDGSGTAGDNTIRPFVFRSNMNGVEVYLAVGFSRPIPSESEIMDEQVEKRYSSEDAGWTVLCNDRAVLHCDRTEMTGWGENRVPRYHTQFIAISGIVEFRSDDPSKLPTTTTKRGIDASSPLYLQVKNKMREGMIIFTEYTNKWKGHAGTAKRHIQHGKPLSLQDIKLKSEELTFNSTRKEPAGEQFKPKLPLPPRIEPTKRRISFVKDLEKIEAVAEYFGDSRMQPAEVGERCFDTIYDEVVQ